MARKFIATFVALPLGILLVAFAVANRHAVTLSFDPLASGAPGLSATLPLFLLIFTVLAAGVLAGGAAAWIKQSKWRRAARRLEAESRALREECRQLRAELAAREPALPPPLASAVA